MRVFRQLQNLIGKTDGKDSLKALLYLLAAANETTDDFDLQRWGLDQTSKEIINRNNTDTLSILIDTLQKGISHKNLKPNLNLILRHTSGRLFQEAHYEAILCAQTQLWDLPTSSTRKSDSITNKGVYFTPSYLTRSIVEECLKHFDNNFPQQLIVFDPACGSGEFLKEAIRQLKLKDYNGKIKCIGWDISSIAIDMANFILNYENREWNENKIEIDLKVVNDSLEERWPVNVNILLMNPPYISWELMKDNQRETVKSILGNYYQKNPNIASAFLWNAVNSLKSSSIIGCVIPSSLLNADSYKKLRNELLSRTDTKLIGKLGSYIFYGALTDASIYIAKKTEIPSKGETTILWAKNEIKTASDAIRGLRKFRINDLNPINENIYSIYKVSDINQENLIPISYKSFELKAKLDKLLISNSLIKTKDIFNVKLGVRTGKNNVFLVDKSFYARLSKDEKKYFRPAVTNQSISDGKLKTVSYIWYPYGYGMLNEVKTESELQKVAKIFYQSNLRPNKDFLKNRREVREGRFKWWDLTREGRWQYEKIPKLVSTEFGSAGSFAFDRKGEYIIERGHGWLPKEAFNNELHYSYLALFNSNFFNELLYIYSKQISSNSWYLAGKFVNELPIPNLFMTTFTAEFNKLINMGEAITLGAGINYSDLDNTVRSLYRIEFSN